MGRRPTRPAPLNAWEKVAVVSGADRVRNATRIFGFQVPCPVRPFHHAALEDARRWIRV